MTRKILLALIIIFVILQLIPSGQPEVIKDNPNDLLVNHQIDTRVATMLKDACYDCHSNESKFPWYANIAPVSYLINRDIREGRKALNFSEWNSLSLTKQLKVLDEISEEVLEGEMPMKIYTPLHPEARLSDADRKWLADWTSSFGEKLME